MKAKRLWRAAENFLRNNMTALAERKLREILKRYPDTEYAKRAKEKLADLAAQ